MTISTTASSTTVVLIAAQTVVPFSFIADAASDITVQTTNTSTGISTTLAASQYTVTLNSATTGQLWGVGGYVTLNGAPGVGYTCTITRTLPLQQLISIQNQGDFAPQVTEQALDTLCMEIQQISARGGAYRGVWATGIIYNFGDIVQDGINGAYTNNIYVCAIANTSGTWATDLASGDWSLALNIQTINASGTYLPLSGGTISGNLGVTGTTTVAALSASGTISGAGFSSYLASPPAIGGTVAAAGNFTMLAGSTSIKLNGSPVFDKINEVLIGSSGTYTPSTGLVYADVDIVGGGGAGGGANTGTGSGSGGGSGEYAFATFTAATIGSSQTVTIGAGGTSVSGGTGGTGGTTSFGSLLTAVGGTGGAPQSAGGIGGTGGTGGNRWPGQQGFPSLNCSVNAISGAGGNSAFGSGGAGQILGGGTSAGFAATGYGAGGGGGAEYSGSNTAGGSGNHGVVRIKEYISA